jgi:ABC-2 type transport system permease protein
MWLRQLKRFWRSKPRIIGGLGQPLLFLFALGMGFGPVFAAAGQGDYITFLAPGIIAMSVLFTAMFNGIEVIWERQFGFLKETLVAPVSRTKIMLGKTLGGATVAAIQGTIVIILALLCGFRPVSIGGLLLGLVFMFLIAVLFTAFGVAIASKMQDLHGFQLIISFIIMPLFFLSGSLYPLDNLPPSLHIATTIDPLTYGVDGLRGALTGVHHHSLLFDGGIILGLVIITTIIGSYLFSKVEV